MKHRLQLITTQPPQAMQLKYCERCGNLWLRRSGSDGTTCAPCSGAEAELANGTASFLRLWTRMRAESQALCPTTPKSSASGTQLEAQ